MGTMNLTSVDSLRISYVQDLNVFLVGVGIKPRAWLRNEASAVGLSCPSATSWLQGSEVGTVGSPPSAWVRLGKGDLRGLRRCVMLRELKSVCCQWPVP